VPSSSAVVEVVGSLTATVDQLSSVALTTDQLNLVVTSLPVPVDMRYHVTDGPRHGELVLIGGAASRTFTQQDVDDGRLLYRHRDVTSIDTDHFRFRLVSGGGHLGEDELVFTIRVSYELRFSYSYS